MVLQLNASNGYQAPCAACAVIPQIEVRFATTNLAGNVYFLWVKYFLIFKKII